MRCERCHDVPATMVLAVYNKMLTPPQERSFCDDCGQLLLSPDSPAKTHMPDGAGGMKSVPLLAEFVRRLDEFPPSSGDPVMKDESGWWFYDETWADRHGPYTTEAIARDQLKLYCHWLEHGPPPTTEVPL